MNKRLIIQQKKSEVIGSKQNVLEIERENIEISLKESEDYDKEPIKESIANPFCNMRLTEEDIEYAYYLKIQ